MKKRNIVIRYLVLLMLIVTFLACESKPKQESAGEYLDDSVITTKVKSLLAADDLLKSFQISVETNKGIVQLIHLVSDFASYNRLNLALDTEYDYRDLWRAQLKKFAGEPG